ncbi:MAG: Gldg family protein [Candidatus Lernaella stagnicola]|nr:Gldg family protein [Candidatus Lernaella stagnicola]
MERIWALYKKELRTYFNSPIAYIVLMVLLVGIGYLFFQTFFAAGQATLRNFFRVAAGSFIFFAPAVTMKLLAEEKKSGTIERLLTLPLHEWEIVLGKFLATWTLLALYLVITFVYPISIAFVGDLDGGPIIGGYLGLFFLGGTFVALGVFASSISRNQVVGLIVGFVIALLLYMMDLLLPFVPSSLQNLWEFAAADPHFKNVGRGVLDSRDIIYSLSLMSLFLFLAVQAVQSRMSDHSKKWRLNRLLYIGAAIGCVISLNVFSSVVHGRIDLTEDQQFTLSDASSGILAELDDQVTVTAFFSKDIPAPANSTRNVVKDLLEEFRDASGGRVVFSFVDPDTTGSGGESDQASVQRAQQLGVPKIDMQAFAKDQVQVVKVYMGVAVEYGEKSEAIPVIQDLPGLEYELISRIASMTREKVPAIGVVSGHGEFSLQQGFGKVASMLGSKFDVKDVDLSRDPNALNGMDVLLLLGPKKQIPEAQLFAIDQFMMRGGKAAFFLAQQDIDPRTLIGRPIDTGLAGLAEAYGVAVKPGLVLDKKCERIPIMRQQGSVRFQSLVRFPAFVAVTDLPKDLNLTRNLKGVVMPFASALAPQNTAGVETQVLARSSEATWIYEASDSFLAEPAVLEQSMMDNPAGPQPLIVTVKGNLPSYFKNRAVPPAVADAVIDVSPETRLVVAGSGQWVSDQMPSRVNLALFANLLDWLVQDEVLMSIRTRTINNRPLEDVGDVGRSLFKYGNMLLPPFILLIAGIARWQLRSRRKRRALAAIQQNTPRGEE